MIRSSAQRPGWSKYAIGVLAAGLGAALRMALLGTLGTRAPYVTYYPAVVVAALAGGLPGGLVATVLCALTAFLGWIEPVGTVYIRDSADDLAAGVFVISAALITWITESMWRAQRRASDAEARVKMAMELNRMKTEFLVRSSHELRTPLNAIVGYSDLLGEQSAGPLPSPYPRYVANIQEGAHHLLDLVNDLLDLSRIEAGKIELHLERLDVSALLDEILSLIRPLAEIKKISVENRITPGMAVMSDRMRFKQILYNLISNAVKFTPEEGCVWIEGATNGGAFTVCVGDTGLGIAPDEKEVIFEEFRQATSARKLDSSGAGLGLAIVRKLARLHGGDVSVESEPGKGSRFLVSLPAAKGSIADTISGEGSRNM